MSLAEGGDEKPMILCWARASAECGKGGAIGQRAGMRLPQSLAPRQGWECGGRSHRRSMPPSAWAKIYQMPSEWQQNPSHQSPLAGILVVTGDERCTYSWLEVCVCTCLLLYHLETHSAGPSPGKRQKTGTGKGLGRYVPQGLPDSKASDGCQGRARPKGSQGVAR